jgi:hypothetical protein
MVVHYDECPVCGHFDLAPRQILVGQGGRMATPAGQYREILTLKCQNCGWLGEQFSL